MERRPRPYMTVVAALMKKELRGLVEERSPAAWRETLALLCTYAPKAQWAELTEVSRLAENARGGVD
jgi:protein transport protein SEC31